MSGLVKNQPKKLDMESKETVMLTASAADASTGLLWAVGMLKEVEDAVLVVREDNGHARFVLGGEK